MAYFRCGVIAGNKIKVTCSADFAGITIHAKNGTSDLTQVCPSTAPYIVEFDVANDGVWQVQATLNGALYNKNVVISNSVAINLKNDVNYGFYIDGTQSDPDKMVSYTDDAADMIPAHMDFTNDVFDYGTWENAFFMPRPCMLKYDGTVDYYLDTNDYTKKADGITASDVANTSYNGNAMMEWGQNGRKIWMRLLPSDDGASVKVNIANYQVDSDYHDWCFHNCDGVSADHFYTSIYSNSLISNKMRSLSGQAFFDSKTTAEEIAAATANNTSAKELWNIETFADHLLISMLLVLMGKTTNVQNVFGSGYSSNVTGLTSGVHNSKGLFYGTDNTTPASFENVIKVFGMENFYAFKMKRMLGLIVDNGAAKVKLTYGQEDGSTTTGYNLTGNGYIALNNPAISGNGAGIKQMHYTRNGMIYVLADSLISDDSYYCDYGWFKDNIVVVPQMRGYAGGGTRNGIFCQAHDHDASNARAQCTTTISCRPLVA